jgi:hypothetical protein
MSKIMKTATIRKNRDKNSSHVEVSGSNPHANGDVSSRSSLHSFEIKVARIITAVDSKIVLFLLL